MYAKQISLTHLVRSPLLMLVVCVFVSNVKAQCTQKLSDLPPAPELLGFHIGMNKEEVKALVPQTRFGGKDAFGVSKTTINPYFDESIDKARFPAVRSVSLEFLGERLTSLWIGFDETFKVQQIDQFATSISQSLRIPNAWQRSKSTGKQMKCADFQISLQIVGGGPSLRIVDALAEDTVAARRQAKESLNSAIEEAVASGAEETAIVIGDTKTKMYYQRSCEAINEVSGENLVVFKTPEEAEKAGFKVSKRCD